MGTSIELKVSGVSLDYAKNNMGNDYGYLFQEPDLARRPCDGIDYNYYLDHPEQEGDLAESELAFVRPLARVIPRLDVLGCTLEGARAEYEAVVADATSISESQAQHLTFEEFCALATCSHWPASPTNTLNTTPKNEPRSRKDASLRTPHSLPACLGPKTQICIGPKPVFSRPSYASSARRQCCGFSPSDPRIRTPK